MFGALITAMLLAYGILTVATIVLLPVVIIQKRRSDREDEARHSLTQGYDDSVFDDLALEDDPEERAQLTRARLQTTAEAAARSHDRILEAWVEHLQDEQMSVAPGPDEEALPAPAVQQRLLDALDAARDDRVDPADPALDHYAVGLYATRVRELDAAWTAYCRARGE